MANEASTLSSDANMPAAFPALVRKVLPTASDHTVREIQDRYDGTWEEEVPEKLAWEWTGDAVFFCHALDLAREYEGKTWRYVMGVEPAVHGQDMGYYFYPEFGFGLPVEGEVARGVQRLLGEFVWGEEMVVGVDGGGGERGERGKWEAFGKERNVLDIGGRRV